MRLKNLPFDDTRLIVSEWNACHVNVYIIYVIDARLVAQKLVVTDGFSHSSYINNY